jgi:hypothetical protein
MKPILLTVLMSIALVIASCGPKPKARLVVGKWEFEKAEHKNIDGKDEKSMNENSKGVIATFNENGTFYSIQPEDGTSDTLETGTYELTEKDKFLVTHTKERQKEERVEVIELTDKIFKIQTSDSEILTLKRIQ